MADETKAVEAAQATAAAAEANTAAVVAEAKAGEAAGEAAIAAGAAAAAVESAAVAEQIATDAATRDAGKRLEEFEGALATCRNEIASLKTILSEIQASHGSIQAELTKLAWLKEIETMTEAKPATAGSTSDSASGSTPTGESSSVPASPTKAGEKPAVPESVQTPAEPKEPKEPAAKKRHWL
jgi:hypothetical protein